MRDLIDALSASYGYELLRHLHEKSRARWHELQEELDAPRATLHQRIKTFQRMGWIRVAERRREYPFKTVFAITRKGQKVAEALKRLEEAAR